MISERHSSNDSPANSLIFTGGKIFGGVGWKPPKWYEAVSIKNGMIYEVGDFKSINRNMNSAEVIDISGAVLFPGLCDAHLHLAFGGQSLDVIDLGGLDYLGVRNAIQKAIDNSNRDNNIWVEAFNWDISDCSLTIDDLDEWIPDKPLVIHKRDLHGCCCNTLALRVAGITPSTVDPPEGRIGRGPNGKLNGMLYETAVGVVRQAMPAPSAEVVKRNILKAQQHLLSLGITAVSEVLEKETEDLYYDLCENNELILMIDAWRRIEHHPKGAFPPDFSQFKSHGHTPRLKLDTLKLFLDGSFGSKTAALFEPYLGDPDNSGILLFKDASLLEILKDAFSTNWSVAMHAIGDRAVVQACSIISKIGNELNYSSNIRKRIEHAEIIPANGIKCLIDAGIIASMQPVHWLDDRRWLSDIIGEQRVKRCFTFKTLLEHNIPLSFGSDWPVANPDPMLNIHTAINFEGFNRSAPHSYQVTERLLPWQAVRATTWGWAEATGTQNVRGAVHPGMIADLTVVKGLDDEMKDWSNAEIVYTICDGKIVYQN